LLAAYKKQFKRKPEPILYPEGIGGPEICNFNSATGRREYYRRTAEMALRQRGKCSICGFPMKIDDCTYEHQDGRGMNGGHRDDRIVVDGKPYNSAAHGLCNVRKGSVRLKNFKEVA
jgi:hypothetical protein